MKKKEGISRGARHFFTFLKGAIPKTLFVCTCVETNRVALLPSWSVTRCSN
jgi:hypothetical protein